MLKGRKPAPVTKSYIIGHNITESQFSSPSPSTRRPTTVLPEFAQLPGCKPQWCRVIAKNETTDTCYCSGDLCNADQNWSTATENSTSLKCHYESPCWLN
ncbi:hypothetical protein BV898_10107 [Hypsibius exemplaris]|uniref:Uncharacterized protein n=1 Tax=Hypsibius exemplaris TaxID=2072580 RepID=A0A1W0WKJ5_HYPEX|nr:hypothetical protein BV898_10107 [Hypsibius exemplaris]